MGATIDARSAPPIVRRIGYYLLVLSGLSLWALIVAADHGELLRYQLVAFPIVATTAVGLIREKKWAYVAALVVTGIYALFFLGVLVFNVIWPSGLGLTVGLVLLVNLAVVAPPLLLLGEQGRAWFQGRETADLAG